MNSLKLVEAVLESLPQLSIQTWAFFTIGEDSLVFSVSASISIGCILYNWYNFLSTRKDIEKAMIELRRIFGDDVVNPPPPPIVPPPPPLFGGQ